LNLLIDVTPPTSSVALPPYETSTSFTVNWSGSDPISGITSYNVYESDNGGAYTVFRANTTQTSAPFIGQNGHTYRFYSIATDKAGNVQSTPTVAQATALVDVTPQSSSVAALPQSVSSPSFTLRWSGSDPISGIASYNVYVSDNGGPYTL